MPEEENEVGEPEEPDILDQFDQTPEGEFKQADMDENLNDSDLDFKEGFGGEGNSLGSPFKDSLLKFNRWVIGLFSPKKVVRVANFTFKESKNCKIFLNFADYNQMWGNGIVAQYLNNRAVVEASVSMGKKGFTMTNMMTQRRVVTRQSEKLPKTSDWSKGNQQGGIK